MAVCLSTVLTATVFERCERCPFEQPGWIHDSVFFLSWFCFSSSIRDWRLLNCILYFCFSSVHIWSSGFDREIIRNRSNLKQSVTKWYFTKYHSYACALHAICFYWKWYQNIKRKKINSRKIFFFCQPSRKSSNVLANIRKKQQKTNQSITKCITCYNIWRRNMLLRPVHAPH